MGTILQEDTDASAEDPSILNNKSEFQNLE